MSEQIKPKVKYIARLERWANSISAYLHCPVFLAGSALYKEDYRDVDVFALISDWDFELRFGPVLEFLEEGQTGKYTEIRWSWARECSKQWRAGCSETGMNLDFKIISHTQHKQHGGKPVYRLDNNPNVKL